MNSASNFVLSLNIPLQKLFGCFRRLQLWTTGDWQLHQDSTPAHASRLVQSFLVKHQIPQVIPQVITQSPYSPDLAPCNFWPFPKLKSPLKGKRFQTVDKIQENMMGQQVAIGTTLWSPNVPTLKGTEVSLSYIQCLLYLVSCSINASIFQIAWLDTFWTDLILILLIHPQAVSLWFQVAAIISNLALMPPYLALTAMARYFSVHWIKQNHPLPYTWHYSYYSAHHW